MLLVSATLLFCLSGAAIFAVQGRQELLREQLLQRARVLLAALGATSREALLTERHTSLRLLVRKIYTEDKDVLSIHITDRSGLTVASTPTLRKLQGAPILFQEDITSQGYRLGKVELQIRPISLEAAVDRSTLFLLLALFDIILLVGFVVHMSIKGFVSRPLEHLLDATEKISQGDFSQRSELTTSDEIGVLSRAFDTMAESLERFGKQAEETHQVLETRVIERTQELQEAQAHTAAILENLPVSVLVVDGAKRLTAANPAARALCELPTAGLPNRPCSEVLATPLCASNCLLDCASRGDPHIEETQLALDGRPVLLECSPLGSGGIVTVRDMSRIHTMRAQIRRSDRLSSLGTLAAGLAHEINNPLGNVSTYAQLLQETSPSSSRWNRLVQTIRQESVRASTIVGRLLAFAHPAQDEVEEVSLNDLAASVETLLGPVLKKDGVSFHLCLPEPSPRSRADLAQLQQVLVNLLLNAAQATGEGGQVELEVLPETGESVDKWPGFQVRDNGPGIPQEFEDHLFDPFFTTKEVGEGTGLGLSVCYGIVRDHGGDLSLKNRSHGGAEATVRLPPRPESKQE
jgi:signal transduction histidine kinase/HAMP domain-containing protein